MLETKEGTFELIYIRKPLGTHIHTGLFAPYSTCVWCGYGMTGEDASM